MTTKTAKSTKIESAVEEATATAENKVKSLFRVIDPRSQGEQITTAALSFAKRAVEATTGQGTTIRNVADRAIVAAEEGATVAVKGVADLGRHVVDATAANIGATVAMVESLSDVKTFAQFYEIETNYVRTIARQNMDQVSSAVSLVRNVLMGVVKTARAEYSATSAVVDSKAA